MGEKYLEQKAKRFKQKCDIEHERELRSPDLLSVIKDRSQKHYRFYCPSEQLKAGNTVVFVAEKERHMVSVFRGARRIGEVDGAASAELKAMFLVHSALGDSIKARVCEGPDIAGYYEATILSPGR